MSVYYVFIVLPMIVMGVLIFIFQSSLEDIASEQFKMNCPLPIYDGVATNLDIEGVNLVYDVTLGNGTSNDGTMFQCTSTDGLLGASTIAKPYGDTLFNTIPYGYFGFLSDSISTIGFKLGAFLKLIYLYWNAPAEVTNLAWFTVINFILSGFIGFGGFMVARGNGG